MYYKGNTIGLNYDAATGNWSFSNEPNDFIDTNAFSTADPKFDYVPPSNTTPDEPENDPCPAGYKYDSTLKQCVIDPDYQNPFMDEQTQTGDGGYREDPKQIAGTNRTTTDGNYRATDAEYENMSASELIENYKQRGFVKINDKGELTVNLDRVGQGGSIMDALLGRISGGGEGRASVNKVIGYLLDKGIVNQNDIYQPGGASTTGGTGTLNTEIVIPTIAKFEADYYNLPYSEVLAPGFGNKIFGTRESVQQFDDYMAQKLAAFSTVANNAVTNYTEDNYLAASGIKEQQEKEKARKAKADADKAEAEKERKQLQLIEERRAQEEKEERQRRQEEFEKSGGDITQRRKEEEKRKSDFVNQQQEVRGKSKSEAERDYVRQQAKSIAAQKSQFKKDTARTPSGKSYTQSKIEQAAKTGRYSGF